MNSTSVGQNLFDGGAKGVVWHHARMVKGDVAATIEQDERGRGTGAVAIEVLFADGHGNGLESGIEMLPDTSGVGEFILRFGILTLGRVAVELSGSNHGKSLSPKLRTQAGDDWAFVFAINAPVGPEK